jgi:hypothetical protein
MRVWILAAVVIAVFVNIGAMEYRKRAAGCRAYIAANQPLIAHAGGGLPDRIYANNITALDLAARHHFKVVELDFQLVAGQIRLGHDSLSETTFGQLLTWLRAHPDLTVITDAKTANVPTLTELVREAGPMKARFRPQIYSPREFKAVYMLGMLKPVLTVYRIGNGWQSAANALDVAFVTVPEQRKDEARGVRHPIYLHTVNRPMPGYGLYTDCLVPASAPTNS